MRIVADENIPLLEEFFASFAQVERYPGRSLSAAQVRDADVLLVRSVTPVNADLLEDSRVGFVGTCTIGTDHLDLAYLAQNNIAWASAPGCNARGVVDYVLSSILLLADEQGVAPESRCYGVVGVGQVGGRLLQVLNALGWTVLACDPPRARAGEQGFVCLDELVARCDVISVHTPLNRQGEDATWHLFDQQRLAQLKPSAWLINASRGAVVDNAALKQLLSQRSDLQVVLDVWEGEPLVDVELAQLCRVATPHIAGYSLDGKLRGTEQIYQELCAWRQQPASVQLAQLMPPAWLAQITLDAKAPLAWALKHLVRSIYDPRRDSADFMRSLVGDELARRQAFDRLRKNYPIRRELTGLKVQVLESAPELQALVRSLGAQLL